MTEVLRVTAIAKRYGATTALDNVDLDVHAGEVHALIGENGAGKSTLMGVLAGAVTPDTGNMTLTGTPYAPSSQLEARRSGVALIHQELSLCPHLTVEENVLLGTEISNGGLIDRRRSRERARQLLDELPHPEIRPERKLAELSLAARQIVEICRALAAEASVVLMDEPTSSLQSNDVDRLFALIQRLTSRGIAVIYISHFLEEVRRVADRYTVLRNGRSVASGSMRDVTNDGLIASMVGRETSELFPVRTRVTFGNVKLAVRGLALPPRLHSATLEVRAGEILGIAGLLGSGRTELVRALFGLEQPTAGTIEVNGQPVEPKSVTPAQRVREGVGYVSEDRKGEGLALPMSIGDNLCATKPVLAQTSAGVIDMARQASLSSGWIRKLRVAARSPAQAVRALSGGNQQKVAIGRLLHQEAQILLLDEPTRGIDIGSKVDVYEIIARQADAGCAVLMVSSYLPELFGLCDRLAVMCRGRLSETKTIGDWTSESVLATAIGDV